MGGGGSKGKDGIYQMETNNFNATKKDTVKKEKCRQYKRWPIFCFVWITSSKKLNY